ncbi:MAG: DNA-binding transcriptional regulator [Candidatus Dactylopiibacterium carminicum]|uniref:DNA-binding transcriptional regulator n=1 Tax=Candidatus Dactylopiibacterium carminicum TaxID=857335 RepID=A0A272ET40_9RHOO|nr:YafY family protein [Candidatus Dactylopiibacterium carminicum]KAF7599182.1 YafY family transcriptional regulator [Candidatus Dactylopiibacterium carminicum]PAS93247.1 MAG: DNA-binding transcriptional regulator [Candidatus Dactylopiibacterium carminicum]PAS97118.1 MAG: DNA-binding transcriptional regulator [Candidatus Dactylopiibacterium carminicum]PAS99196.1 MAG: DNA-binding transcriptional regulator [Candidatus Dactylopiibacterium carminicum]
MRRADRLFRLVELLRSRHCATGAWLAEQLQVSLRTLYRDIRDLSLSGVPIEGEAGVGYRLRYRMDVPPLMFDAEELEALLIGTRMVQAWADADLARAASGALAKIHNALPEARKREARLARIFVPPANTAPAWLGPLREAIRARHIVHLDYSDAAGARSQRSVWPLGLFFWGAAWTLIGWCQLRDDFRHFRLDRMLTLDVGDESFPDQPGRRLDDFFDQLERRESIRITRD